ncbi:hypothetical protein H310_08467 [Aphanomyces invadans]|uniref:Exoribonuclease phosphorolytic domain-containing protein n=1 Tax=Aphanomyces invadans TaxID=157072 RepID=A0A024TXW4_9STRA|nr:hypothetical protein H310_08467 [Aphanomyces invadans]ETV98995.1 hypothetical protein H310_08467 [Aphanomyces invadans]|eukprot:XP_008872423.1 hypothetical protein H310_08467 [Aphanomyces invadans]
MRVLAVVSGEIVAPFPDRPTEGFLRFQVELSPMGAATLEHKQAHKAWAAELSRIVERSIRDCKALDTEALAIVAGESVWAIKCTVHILDHGGNLVDAVSIASISALMHFRRPESLGSITYTFNSYRELCAVHKIGGVSIDTDVVLRCANIAAAKVGTSASNLFSWNVLQEFKNGIDNVP